jgi:hypothetical protein
MERAQQDKLLRTLMNWCCETHTNILDTLNDFSLIHPKVQCTVEVQDDNNLNYLDITIINSNNTFTFDIFRKPTTTNIIIPNDSCHPTEHKMAAIRYMNNRRNTYPISTEQKHNETYIINTILHNNGYTPLILCVCILLRVKSHAIVLPPAATTIL